MADEPPADAPAPPPDGAASPPPQTEEALEAEAAAQAGAPPGVKQPRFALLVALRNRNFRLLLSGQAVSDIGDWLDFVGLITLVVYTWEMGAAALAGISIAVALPRIVIGPFAGVWVDRWPQKTIMVATDVARAFTVFALVFAPNLATVLALVVVKNAFSTFFNPARQAAIRATVPEEDLLAANSASQASFQLGKVIGPTIGGLIVAATSPDTVFAIDAVTFLVSAAFLIQLPHLGKARKGAEEAEEEEEGPSFWTEFREGVAYIVHRRTLTLAIGSMSAALFMIFIIDSIGVLVLKELGVSEGLFGLAVGSIGLGTVLGALAVGQYGKKVHPFRIMGGGQILSGSMVAFLGLAVIADVGGHGLQWVAVYMAIGFAAAAIFVPYGYVLQVETRQELMGRVFATADGVETGFQLVAPALGAALSEVWGVGPVFGVAGVALALVGAVVFIMRPQVGAAGTDSGEPQLEPSPSPAT